MNQAARPPRERILAAMVQIASTRGYEGIAIAEVIERAEVSRETFDEMFPSIDTCFLEAYDAVVDVLVARCVAAFEGDDSSSWAERITAGLRVLTELIAAEAEIARMALVEIAAAGEDARYRYGLALERFIPFLEQGRDASPQGAELPPETARFALGGAAAMIFDEIRAGRGPQLPRLLPELVFTVTMPYLGAERAETAMAHATGD